MRCDVCGEEFEKFTEFQNHIETHQLMHVSDDPLSYLLDLGGRCSGGYEAAEAFTEAIRQLREKHPDVKFTLLPFSYNGENPALSEILTVQE